MKAVIITTAYRGVFFGMVPDDQCLLAEEVVAEDVRMAIYWGTKRGIMELAEDGPNPRSNISKKAPRMGIRAVTGMMEVTEKARAAWVKHGER